MKLVILLGLVAYSLNVTAEDEQLKMEKTKVNKQEMEQVPSSNPYGGARSGDLEIEKQRDEERMRYELEKQRRLYEYEDRYRKGL